MIIKDFILHSGIKILYELKSAHTLNHNQELTDVFIYKTTVLKTECQQNICYTQEHMAEQINHCWNPILNYQVEDIVWLNTQNIYNDWCSADKLNLKTDEPF